MACFTRHFSIGSATRRDEVGRVKGLKDTVDVTDAVGSYYRQLFMNNPSGITFYDDGWGNANDVEEGEELGEEVFYLSE